MTACLAAISFTEARIRLARGLFHPRTFLIMFITPEILFTWEIRSVLIGIFPLFFVKRAQIIKRQVSCQAGAYLQCTPRDVK